MDIDKLILSVILIYILSCFSSLMDIDKLIQREAAPIPAAGFSSLMDIDKLIRGFFLFVPVNVLVH